MNEDTVTDETAPPIDKMHNLSEEEETAAVVAVEENFRDGRSWLNPHYEKMEANEEFAYEDQWDKDERAEREGSPASARPCLTFNKVLRIGKRIVNDVKQAHFGIKFIPVDDGADALIAEVYNALVKKIERDNRCESVRQAAFEQALFGGGGFYRCYTDWDGPTMKKKIVTKRIINRQMVLFSRTSIEPDLSDSPWFIIHEILPKAAAEAKYPGVVFQENYGGNAVDYAWYNGEGYCILEQFIQKHTSATLVMLDDAAVLASAAVDEPTKAMWKAMGAGNEMAPKYKELVVFQDDMDTEQKMLWEALPASFRKLYSRKAVKKTWWWYKFAGRKCIACQEWEGEIAPLIFMRGREYWLKGKRNWISITTMLKDPQILYNYYRSTQAERLTMAADAPWLLTAEHIAGYEELWKTAHTRPLRYLLYNLKHNNEELPAPKRTEPIMGDPGLDNEVARLDRELLDISGINLATLGEPSGERTGKAILVRQRQGELINADYTEGYMEALYREGSIYLDLIPRTYKWDEAIRLLGNEHQELVRKLQKKGLLGWGNGKYDLEVEIGSVSSTAREDEKQFWGDLIQANPQIAPLVMDKLVEHSGNKDAKLLAKRFKAVMPPAVQNITENDDEIIDGANHPAVQQANAQVQQVQQQAQQAVQQAQQQAQQAGQEAQKATAENTATKNDMTLKNRELDIREKELALKKLELEVKETENELKNGIESKRLDVEMEKLRHGDREPGAGASEK